MEGSCRMAHIIGFGFGWVRYLVMLINIIGVNFCIMVMLGMCLRFVENLENEELIFKVQQIEFVGLPIFHVVKLILPPFVGPLFIW